jgi:hypothetical protein
VQPLLSITETAYAPEALAIIVWLVSPFNHTYDTYPAPASMITLSPLHIVMSAPNSIEIGFIRQGSIVVVSLTTIVPVSVQLPSLTVTV